MCGPILFRPSSENIMRLFVTSLLVGTAVLASVACSAAAPPVAAPASTTAPAAAVSSATVATVATAAPAVKDNNAPTPEKESADVESDSKGEPQRQTEGGRALSADEVVELALADIEAYWSTEFEQVYGTPYKPLSGGLHPYSSTQAPPSCGGEVPLYEEVAGNAFYCDTDDLVAWDAEGLVPPLNEKFGSFAVALVFAHEFGHVIQGRVEGLGQRPTIVTEQQADCFAGSWTKHVADGKSEKLELLPGALEGGMSALIDLRDPPGRVEAVEEGAHGNAFDRVNAYQTGFDGGAKACAPLLDSPLDVTEVRFATQNEADTGGNMDPAELIRVVPKLLNGYWTSGAKDIGLRFNPISEVKPYATTDEVVCNGKRLSEQALANEIFVCVPDSYVAFDQQLGQSVYREIGDWGLATLLSKQWVAAIQAQNGIDDTTKIAQLEGACFSGSFSRALADGVETDVDGKAEPFSLSAGDLDEAVITYLVYSPQPSSANPEALTSFARVRAFRTGFFQGEKACLNLTAG